MGVHGGSFAQNGYGGQIARWRAAARGGVKGAAAAYMRYHSTSARPPATDPSTPDALSVATTQETSP
jgi:hypothetical protein